MSRGFAVVVSALAAFAAQAQESKGAEAQSATTDAATVRGARPLLVAIRTDSPPPATSRAAGAANGESGSTRSAAAQVDQTGCTVVEMYLGGTDLAARNYEAPRSSQKAGWTRAPFVAAVTRCGRLYILQVKSKSSDPWIIRQARLEAPGGVVLRVEALHSKESPDQGSINVIVAKAPGGAKLPTLKLDLSGEDGRVAQTEAGDLP